ncbi:oxidoreductase [Dulcicalothrix desertica PCC 7102]|uniref:Oxidoreductase n=1 Tax=Dulcicalothrix desertica PCC 7102 TaxID=232991 RepID=A0A3S1CQ63_9CYAN|nr:SDR family oxidoreductase [Dulcicalothrix desertica]RUT06414.1 oxidoreductase [Dulcicalothrix desertica PCC 7102]TWH50440.1 NADP-dependent 3-hydroxy acid dehydrogenase YdfG [Dulcicalothrix desertica PCC 7102]
MIKNKNTQKVVLITGASSGIGEATARLLAHKNLRVVLGARRTNKLEAIVSEIRKKGGVAEYRALDVTSLEDMQAFVDFAKHQFGRIDVVVNNAGLMPLSKLEMLKIDEWNRMIDVNIRGVLHGIAVALPIFKQQQSGQFVNLSSIGGNTVFPNAAVYCATKFAVSAISEGLRQESTDIRVTVISPGATQSELASTTTDAEAAQWVAKFRELIIPADAIARAIAFAIEQPEDVDVSEIIVQPKG